MKNKTEQMLEIMFKLGRTFRHQLSVESTIGSLTLIQLETLIFLKKNKDTHINSIAEYFHTTKPTTTTLLKKLISLKLISRDIDKKDRRIAHIKLTNLGEQLLEKGLKKKNEKMREFLTVLSEKDKEQFLNILIKIYNKIENNYEK